MRTAKTARAKDLNAEYTPLEHRHFATIAAIIRTLSPKIGGDIYEVRQHFADELSKTNPKFDRTRFLAASEN